MAPSFLTLYRGNQQVCSTMVTCCIVQWRRVDARPQEIDEAARRRLVKRLYIPLPDGSARKQIVSNLLREQAYLLTPEELEELSTTTDGVHYMSSPSIFSSLSHSLALCPSLCQGILGRIWLTCVARQPMVQSEQQLRPSSTSQPMKYEPTLCYIP